MNIIPFDKKISRVIVENLISIKVNKWESFYYYSDIKNCKHCNISYLGYILHDTILKTTLKRLDELFIVAHKLMFSVTLTQKKEVNKLRKHFTLISLREIPIGYGNGYQYHATFFTNYKDYPNRVDYMARVKKKQELEIQKKEKEITKFKKINSKIITKIISYKSKACLKKYLEKLIS